MTSPARPAPPADHLEFRALFHAVGTFTGEHALVGIAPERLDTPLPVTLLDAERAPVTADPCPVLGVIDGIQAALTLTWREHRPVYLTYAAAGSLGTAGRLVAVRQKLAIACATADVDWVRGLGQPITVDSYDVPDAALLEAAAAIGLATDRDALERELVLDLLERDPAPLGAPAAGGALRPAALIVDGALGHRPADPRLVGVVKTLRTRYLPDESVLHQMPAGWRSPRFVIPAGTHGCPVPRFSAYVRLHDASRRGWDFGLVRLESFDPQLLEPAAAFALAERQYAVSGDGRWDRHLQAVRSCEDALRALRPAVFSLS